MPTPKENLDQSLAKLQTANRIDGSRASYRKDSPNEYAKVIAYLQGGARPTSGVTSDMGMGLMLAEDARRGLTVSPPPPPPPTSLPLQPPNGYQAPRIISQGGTYTGIAHHSTSGQAAVFINTSDPVVIEKSWIKTTGGGYGIAHNWGQNTDLTLRGSRIYGPPAPALQGPRAIELEGIRQFTVENCTIEGCSGIRIGPDQPGGAKLLIRRNRQHNTQEAPGSWGNFIQLHTGGTNGNSYIIEWNEVENEYNLSKQEDMISIISSRNVIVRNNMLKHNSIPGNPGQGANGCITCETADAISPSCENILVEDNHMVDTANGVFFGARTNNSLAQRNRLIQDGYLPPPNQSVRIASGYGGYAILNGCINSHMHENVSGYVNKFGTRNDYDDMSGAAAPHTAAIETSLNVKLPDPITYQMELDEWQRWLAKLASNGITVGA